MNSINRTLLELEYQLNDLSGVVTSVQTMVEELELELEAAEQDRDSAIAREEIFERELEEARIIIEEFEAQSPT